MKTILTFFVTGGIPTDHAVPGNPSPDLEREASPSTAPQLNSLPITLHIRLQLGVLDLAQTSVAKPVGCEKTREARKHIRKRFETRGMIRTCS
jgi:hypothetical protein